MKNSSVRLLFLSAILLPPVAGRIPAAPMISEFLAVNRGLDVDDLGLTSDWIEIHNPGPGPVDLQGWALTDDVDQPRKWVFPSLPVAEGGFLVVRASGQNRTDPAGQLHTGFSLSGEGEFLGLYSPAGNCVSCWQRYPMQFSGVSFGVVQGGTAQGYFAVPTPGAENEFTVLEDYVRDTQFSVDRGFFTAAFPVTITSATPGAVIRYSLDGSIPTEETGILYTGPVTVSTTAVLRARAFRDHWVPSNTDTQTYIFADTWRNQTDAPAGFSRTWGMSSSVPILKTPAKYRMNTAVTQSPVYGPLLIPALTQTLPVLCLTGEADTIFGDDGLHGSLRGTDAEVPAAVEYFDPLNPAAGFTARSGLQMHGGAVRNQAKRAFRLDFTGTFGDGALQYPLFPGAKSETFDQLVLRPGGHDSFAARSRDANVDGLDLAFHASYLRDQFLRLTENEAGLMSPRGRYVHLCINGLYWGVYDLHERPNAEYCAAQSGGDPADWDVLHHNNISSDLGPQVLDGSLESWSALQLLSSNPVVTDADYRQAAEWLGPDGYIDHLLIRMWAGDHDWLGPAFAPGVTGNVALQNSKNWYAARNTRSAGAGPWHFFTWDGEISMGSNLLPVLLNQTNAPPDLIFPAYLQRKLDLDLTGISRSNTPAAPWAALTSHPEFRLKVADRARRLLYNGGVLTPGAAAARIASLAARLDLAIVAESARWSGLSAADYIYTSSPLVLRDTHWRPEVEWLRDTFAIQRGPILVEQLKARSLYPALDPVAITPPGGNIAGDAPVVLEAPAGIIYYTIDGTDPRVAFTGAVAPGAAIYAGPVTTGGVSPFVINARAYDGTWSALTEVVFSGAVAPAPGSLAFTEIYYHPAPLSPGEEAALGSIDPDEFEFLEITNVSGQRVALGSLRFAAGIDFDFGTGSKVQELAPGASVVLGANPAAVQQRFGVSVSGIFENGSRLSNGGERLRLVRADGGVIADFTWNDGGDWPTKADGGGFSLHLLAPLSGTNPDPGENWRADSPSPGVLPGPMLYENWVLDHFTPAEIASGAGTGAMADPDGDRLANVIEFLTKSNPRRPSGSPVEVSFPAPGKVRYTWERRADAGTEYGIALEVSDGGNAWTVPPVDTSQPTDRATVEIIQDIEVPGVTSHFARLRAIPAHR